MKTSFHFRAVIVSATLRAQAIFRFLHIARPSASSASGMAEQNFVSMVTLTDAQREKIVSLELSFEHLLHDAKVDPATNLALRHCQITDRETFAALEDTVDGLKTLALDMGIDLAGGGMRHKREFARITTAWKKARAQADIKVTTEALQKQHGEPVAMLPEDWTSVAVQFKKKFGADFRDEELPSQVYYDDFQERLSAGMLRAESLDQVISRIRQSGSESTLIPSLRYRPTGGSQAQPRRTFRSHGELHVAPGPATTARSVTVLGPAGDNVPAIPETTSW